MKSLIVMLIVIVSMFLSKFTFAQEDATLQETLKALSRDAASQYLNPISSAFGTDLNGAWFHRAPEPKIKGFNIELGIVGMGARFPTDAKSFSVSGTFRFDETQARAMVSNQGYSQQEQDALVDKLTAQYFDVSISGPTIIGSPDEHITVKFPGKTFDVNGQNYTVPEQNIDLNVGGFRDLANADWLPLMSPQLTIGTLFGTQATIRYLPPKELQAGMGTFKYFGYGIQHNPMVWLPIDLPFNVALSYFNQKLEVGDLLTTNAHGMGINISKQLGFRALNITPYAGYFLEDSKMEVNYDYSIQTPGGLVNDHISFEIPGENKSRISVGLNIRFVLVNLNVDYNIGKYNSITAGLFLAI